MIKNNEIRLGNYLNYMILNSVRQGQVTTVTKNRLVIDGITSKYLCAEPIPLTEEFHNMFNCIKDGFGSFEYELPRKNNINVSIVFSDDYVMLKQCDINTPLRDTDIVTIWNKDVKNRDMFVHEFQNLYFDLSGEELTLKKETV